MTFFATVIMPYLAFVSFLAGMSYRVWRWASSPVPFRIPTTCGQQESLPFIRADKLENPPDRLHAFLRMLLEVLLFRSLFRGAQAEKRGETLVFGSAKWLWFFALMFHWSMLFILLRHLRFVLQPVPGWLLGLEAADGFLQIGLPVLYITDIFFLTGLTFLFLRRVALPRLRYISLPSDYLAVLLLIAVGLSGLATRFIWRADITGVKEWALSLVTLRPEPLAAASPAFLTHLILVMCLIAYFPWSKLAHAGGVFLSPTRNLANNSRARRHVNPWNYPAPVHSYAEYENDFREKMRKAGLPLESAEKTEGGAESAAGGLK
ncbi:MAG: sulfate reduction electron transfer complex DsrMKJOP subunit DsrM [Gracilibacteraceae bacterium]|nr:sulfate reduction electron transfer complex DsrMKJOP subunit DsrM [Gracilibacteraceae bacterium]